MIRMVNYKIRCHEQIPNITLNKLPRISQLQAIINPNISITKNIKNTAKTTMEIIARIINIV